jgi:hypothetical protein
MASSYILEVNGEALEAPASCTWALHFISSEESGRDTQSGKMTIDDIAHPSPLSAQHERELRLLEILNYDW